MHEAGWVGISWPKEYGGRGATLIERVIWDEEYAAARAPVLPAAMGLNLCVGYTGLTSFGHGAWFQLI